MKSKIKKIICTFYCYLDKLSPYHIVQLLDNYDPNYGNYVYNTFESEQGLQQKSDHAADVNGVSEICMWRLMINSEHEQL